jgi:hypothetical protein
MPTCAKRSIASIRTVIAMTGVPRIITRLVAYCAHTKSGMRNHVIPGARIVWTVTMKFNPVRMGRESVDKYSEPDGHHVRV